MKAVELDNVNGYCLYHYGRFLWDVLGDIEQAKRYLLKCIEMDKENKDMYWQIAILYRDHFRDYNESRKYYMKALDIDDSRVNLNGGAIAMGHPLGATGAIILGTAVDLLISRKKRLGLISLCTASGMGVSMVIKNMEY